ncbi:integron integrase [Mariniphaga sp.]|uniref:integron integrase n=1 Tax=Mariniphaga sp. TaxID=1954475 RepID=UPI003569BE12
MLKDSEIMNRVENVIRHKQYSNKTETAYTDWIYRFITFTGRKNPNNLGEQEIKNFLRFLAVEKGVSESTQNQALNAIVFFYKYILQISIKSSELMNIHSGKKLPLVLERDKIQKILDQLNGEKRLMVSLLYGSGLRLMECLNLRIRDIDFKLNKLIIRDEKENTERKTILPNILKPALKRQVEKAKIKFEENNTLKEFSGAPVSESNKKKYPKACKNCDWQFIFPSVKLRENPFTKKLVQYHKHASYLQKAIKTAVKKSKINRNVSCNTFRHSFAAHLLEDGYDVHAVQELLGHKDVRTTMKYNQILNKNRLNVHSPLDF